MYARGHHWLKVVYGPIFDRYRKLGFSASRLGLPTTNVLETRRGLRSRFQHGSISWNRAHDKTRVNYT